ncbi:hypothetical protein TNCV_2436161 [Trichonephila clavipes]|nr:hypothetical protein TNCV_2436161 [Trichonephila clavipes]
MELMHVQSVEAQSPPVGVVLKFGKEDANSSVVLITFLLTRNVNRLTLEDFPSENEQNTENISRSVEI